MGSAPTWLDRQKTTGKLMRAIGRRVFVPGNTPTPEQLYGLTQLTWATADQPDHRGYIKKAKIPGLAYITDIDPAGLKLEEMAERIAPNANSELHRLIQEHSGFTRLRNPYRNSALDWFRRNREVMSEIYGMAYRLRTQRQRIKLAQMISTLRPIPTPNVSKPHITAHFMITPVVACLDPQHRFPIINGNDGVTAILKADGVFNEELPLQVVTLSSHINGRDIRDAFDLDSATHRLAGLAAESSGKKRKKPSGTDYTPKDHDYETKDASDIEVLRMSQSVTHRRIHNGLTNAYHKYLQHRILKEGKKRDCRYDLLVPDYDGAGTRLLIEAKSSGDIPNIRMAVGQLLEYRFGLPGTERDCHLAVLLPRAPTKKVKAFLDILGIGIIWSSREHFKTNQTWLSGVASLS